MRKDWFGFTAVGLASPLAWICADAFLIPAYLHVHNKSSSLPNSKTMANAIPEYTAPSRTQLLSPLQYSITAIGSVILQSAVNGLGSGAVAAVTAGSKVSMFLVCPFDAMGSTMATYGGQNIGAGQLERIIPCIKKRTIFTSASGK